MIVLCLILRCLLVSGDRIAAFEAKLPKGNLCADTLSKVARTMVNDVNVSNLPYKPWGFGDRLKSSY